MNMLIGPRWLDLPADMFDVVRGDGIIKGMITIDAAILVKGPTHRCVCYKCLWHSLTMKNRIMEGKKK